MKILSLILCVVFFQGSAAQAAVKVVATLPSFADIARNVGGADVSVVALTKGTQDPHFVDPKPDLILQLNRADLLIRAGLGLEDGWLPPLLVGSRNGKIQAGSEGNLDASTLVALKEVPKGAIDRTMGDVHPGGNPHFMLDPRNGMIVAKAIAEKLGKLDPSKVAEYQKRADAYSKELAQKIAGWEKTLKPLNGVPVVTYHKSWIYFTQWVGMKEEGYVESKPGIPPTPEHVVQLTRLMKERKVRLILIEPYYPRGTADHVAAETQAKVLMLPTEVDGTPGAKTYFGVFDEIARILKANL